MSPGVIFLAGLFCMRVVLSFLLASIVGVAHGTTIWNEQVDGDLPDGTTSAVDVGILSSGSNILMGTLTGGPNIGLADGADEQDSFRFASIGDWSLDMSVKALSADATGFFALLYRYNGPSSDPFLTLTYLSVSNGGLGATTNIFSGNAGAYTISMLPANNTGTVSYVTQLNAVPLPGAVWLFISAICGLLGLRKITFSRRLTSSPN